MIAKREEVPLKDIWNLEPLYKNFDLWQQEMAEFEQKAKEGWQAIYALKGQTSKSPQSCKTTFETYFSLARQIEKLFVFAHLRHDEDLASELCKNAYQRAFALHHSFIKAFSWLEPEILSLSDEKLQELLQADELKDYQQYLKTLIHQKAHVLSEKEETIMSLASLALHAPQKAFSSFNNTDISFHPAIDSEGKPHELTHGSYQLLAKDEDRALRQSAYENLHKPFLDFENTTCELIQGQVQAHVFNKNARGFSSCLEASLFPHNIDVNVYHNLIKSVKSRINIMHRYIGLRKQLLDIDQVHGYDMYVPLVKEGHIEMDYSNSCQAVVDSIKSLGDEYTQALWNGLMKDRWVDIYENKGKRSGAYSSGCYDSYPYILLNFHGTLRDCLVLSHEAGHSMHSYLSNARQPYQYASYGIFLAEIASTLHESFTYDHFLKHAKDEKEKIYILNQQIDDLRATLFRQTLFAEFELKLHELAETGHPLTPGLLKQEYGRLNQEYYGPDFALDEQICAEFLRVPHFYYNFYVYQYATGISAAYAFAELIKEDPNHVDKYLNLLSSGSSQFPLDLLKQAGVDMSQVEPINALLDKFETLLDEFEQSLTRFASTS